jgi:RhtB (resistance to homoserine/threonine) family protein
MEYLPLISTVALIHLLGAVSPGPDFLLTLKNSISHSRKTGIYTAVGVGLGICIHIAYSLAGLAIIISKSILLFNTVKLLGASYLIYLGIKSLRNEKENAIELNKQKTAEDISPFAAIKMGFLTNALNPKVTLLFLGLFTLVITPDTPTWTMAVLSIMMVINTVLWFSLVAIFFTQKRVRSVSLKFQKFFNKAFGGLLILLGIKVAIAKK